MTPSIPVLRLTRTGRARLWPSSEYGGRDGEEHCGWSRWLQLLLKRSGLSLSCNLFVLLVLLLEYPLVLGMRHGCGG